MTMKAESVALYVHIPFCVRKCKYCDFASFSGVDSFDRGRYIDALCQEIDSYKGRDLSVSTIFFGGGTPSLLSADELQKIVAHINSAFEILPDTEFTMEINPGTVTEEKLLAYIAAGVNRISIGLQSIHENELKKLGRIHDYEEFLECYNLVRRLGIKNVNVDLMYGIPDQTEESFKKTLKEVIKLSPEHISAYGLIIEEGTPFFSERESLDFPDEDSECNMYYLAADMLREAGYFHYEISNYAKSELECRHNLTYWHNRDYIGVGLAAYSYFEGRRFGNTRDIHEYASGVRVVDDEELSLDGTAFEFAMLALRLSEGFSLNEYREKFGVDFLDRRKEIISRLADVGYLTTDGSRIRLTERGFYVSNSILGELLLGY